MWRNLSKTSKRNHNLKKFYYSPLTNGAQGALLDGCQAAVVYGQVVNVQSEEYETLQLWQAVVPELQVEYNGVCPALEHVHCLGDVAVIGELANDVEAVLLDAARARIDLVEGGTVLCRLGIDYGQQNGQQPKQSPREPTEIAKLHDGPYFSHTPD